MAITTDELILIPINRRTYFYVLYLMNNSNIDSYSECLDQMATRDCGTYFV